MGNKLKDMEISSVDLCKRGANPSADIKLFKSASPVKGGENMETKTSLVDRIAKFLAGALGEDAAHPITKTAGAAEIAVTTVSLQKSLESILADDTMSAVDKADMMADSLQAFTLDVTERMDAWSEAQGVAKEEDPEEPDEPEDPDDNDKPPEGEMKKGVFDMATISFAKMSPEDRATLDALEKKYTPEEKGTAETAGAELHPDVKKAIDEVAELRKALELRDLTGIAKKYEIIGKKADELAPKLYDLRKAGETYFSDYVALLDEQVQLAESGIFKEIGTGAGGASDLDGTVAELMKSDPKMTREQAVVKAFETNPKLDRFTGKAGK